MNIWDGVSKELAYWDDGLGPVRLWLRDDDAITPTSALVKLGHLTATHDIPATIAVIPNPATTDLVAWAQKINNSQSRYTASTTPITHLTVKKNVNLVTTGICPWSLTSWRGPHETQGTVW